MPRDPKIRMKTLTVEKPKHPFDPFGKPEYDIPNAARFVTMPEIEVTGQATGKPAGKDGHEGTTLAQVPRPDREVRHEPGRCGQCGAGLGRRPVTGVERLSFTGHRRPVARISRDSDAGFRRVRSAVTGNVCPIPRAAMSPAASGGRTVEPVTEEDVRCAA